jgi:hypothetical protein
MATETEWAYLAGLIDGEGYMNILLHTSPSGRKAGRGYARDFVLTICNTSISLLKEMQEKIGFGWICEHKRKRTDAGVNTFTLRFSHNNLRGILPKIIPYLILKKEPAKIMLESLTLIKETKQKEREQILLANDAAFKIAYSKTHSIFAVRGEKRSKENKSFLTNLGLN